MPRKHLQDIRGVDTFNGLKRRVDDTETGSKRPRKAKIANGTQLMLNLTPESWGVCKPESPNEIGNYSPSTIVEAEAHPTPPRFITLLTTSLEERKPESPEDSSTSLGLQTSHSYLPMLDSSSCDTATPPSSPCSNTFDENKIDLRLLIAAINRKLLEPRDFAEGAVETEHNFLKAGSREDIPYFSGITCTSLVGHSMSIDAVPVAGADAIGKITDGHTNAVPQMERAKRPLEISAHLRIQIGAYRWKNRFKHPLVEWIGYGYGGLSWQEAEEVDKELIE